MSTDALPRQETAGPDNRLCECGHTAHWHGELGCEDGPTCRCPEFRRVDPAQVASEAARLRECEQLREEIGRMKVDMRRMAGEANAAEAEVERLRQTLGEIAAHPTTQLNPDGDEQAAFSMRLIAREALREEKR